MTEQERKEGAAKVFKWLIQPSASAVTFAVAELRFLTNVQKSITAMKGIPQLLEIAKRYSAEKGHPEMAEKFDYLIRESPMDWATEQAEEQFRTPINHSLIGTWGVLENCTELTIVNLMQNVGVEQLAPISQKLVNSEPDGLNDERAQGILRRALAIIRNDGTSIAEAYARLLSLYDIGLACDDSVYPLLAEINELRNCLLHRGGLIDDKACRNAPGLRPKRGRDVAVDQVEFGSYTKACHDFLAELMRAAVGSPFMKPFLGPQSP